jgi:hypothetical protein
VRREKIFSKKFAIEGDIFGHISVKGWRESEKVALFFAMKIFLMIDKYE